MAVAALQTRLDIDIWQILPQKMEANNTITFETVKRAEHGI